MAMVEAFAIEPELVRPISRSDYEQMIALGLFQDERVELIRGVLVKMSPQLAPHASTVRKLTQLLVERLKGRFSVSAQLPLALSDDSEPEPDVAILESAAMTGSSECPEVQVRRSAALQVVPPSSLLLEEISDKAVALSCHTTGTLFHDSMAMDGCQDWAELQVSLLAGLQVDPPSVLFL